MPARNPVLHTYRCRRCQTRKIELTIGCPDSWLMLYGYEDGGLYFCSLLCMCMYVGESPLGLEKMSVAIKRIVNDKYLGKAKTIRTVQAHTR